MHPFPRVLQGQVERTAFELAVKVEELGEGAGVPGADAHDAAFVLVRRQRALAEFALRL